MLGGGLRSARSRFANEQAESFEHRHGRNAIKSRAGQIVCTVEIDSSRPDYRRPGTTASLGNAWFGYRQDSAGCRLR